MQAIILTMLVSSLSFEYLSEEGWIPSVLQYTPEVVSMLAAGLIVVAGGATRFRYVRPAYWIALVALATVAVCGLVLNAVNPGPIFTGVRTYVRALPFFLLPAVYPVTQQQLRNNLLLVLCFCLVQLPLAYDQRMHDFQSGSTTGDHTTGTLMNSAFLTIFLTCAAAVLTAFFIRKLISLKVYVTILLLILLPTTLNETKGTLVLLPIAILTTFLAGAPRGARLRNGTAALLILLTFGTLFVQVYDYFVTPRWGYGILDFISMDGRVEGYLSKDAGFGDEKVGRLDAIVVPATEIAKDPATLAFGYGMGNVSDSALGEQFKGRLFRKFDAFLMTTASTLILETGFMGLLLAVAIMVLILSDAISLAKRDDVFGALALGWIGVTVTLIISLFYKTILGSTAIAFVFCYFSGVIAAQRMRLSIASTTDRPIQGAADNYPPRRARGA